jgi:hypothetical protein
VDGSRPIDEVFAQWTACGTRSIVSSIAAKTNCGQEAAIEVHAGQEKGFSSWRRDPQPRERGKAVQEISGTSAVSGHHRRGVGSAATAGSLRGGAGKIRGVRLEQEINRAGGAGKFRRCWNPGVDTTT